MASSKSNAPHISHPAPLNHPAAAPHAAPPPDAAPHFATPGVAPQFAPGTHPTAPVGIPQPVLAPALTFPVVTDPAPQQPGMPDHIVPKTM